MQDILLSPHFSLKEMTESRAAEKHGIANVPSQQEVENLRWLCKATLEPLREKLGLPVIITSGYRSKALNSLLAHSSDHSQHMQGQAADFYVAQGPGEGFMVNGSMLMVQGEGDQTPNRRELLIKAFRLILQDPEIDFDQLILYPSFIHVSYVSSQANRRGILIGRKDGKLGYGRISLSNALKIS